MPPDDLYAHKPGGSLKLKGASAPSVPAPSRPSHLLAPPPLPSPADPIRCVTMAALQEEEEEEVFYD